MVTVYADVLVSVNIIITYIFLVCVRVIFKVPTGKWFVALASILGGLCSLVIFFDDGGIGFGILYKALTGAVITAIAFLPSGIKQFLKLYGGFFGVSAFFGGVIFFVETLFDPRDIVFINGAVYFNMSVTYLVGVVFVVYGVFWLFDRFLFQRYERGDLYEVRIDFRGTELVLTGFVDTGNSMRDVLSGNLVFVAGQSDVAPLFSYSEIAFLKSGGTQAPPDSLAKYCRLLPCSTVTGKGLLPAFLPDSVTLHKGKTVARTGKVTIAVSPDGVGDDYGILLNKSICDLAWKESENEDKFF